VVEENSSSRVAINVVMIGLGEKEVAFVFMFMMVCTANNNPGLSIVKNGQSYILGVLYCPPRPLNRVAEVI
jgi:hypothetical protein